MRFSPQMRDVLIGCALALLLVGAVPVAHAEDPGKVDLEALEMVSELIGAPVFSKDGTEVGQVADIAFDDQLQPQRLRMTTRRHLGLGARTIEIPREALCRFGVPSSSMCRQKQLRPLPS